MPTWRPETSLHKETEQTSAGAVVLLSGRAFITRVPRGDDVNDGVTDHRRLTDRYEHASLFD
ncbi:MAG: hypothetical protein O2815_04600 [Actinomycetota bacterium]|nr:hypothetical protein [Actinomycetota bacterium]